MLNLSTLPPRTKARYLAVAYSRVLGAQDGHPFYGNQWTDAPGGTKDDFISVGKAQRYGDPERLMEAAQFAMGGGRMNVLIEHVGDLTHRMTEPGHMFEGAGYNVVKDKVEKTLDWVTSNPRGFAHDFEESLKSNADYSKVPFEEWQAKTYTALDKYADAHAKIPVFNEAQRVARDTAVALGRRQFDKVERGLRELKSHLGTKEEWVKYAHAGLRTLGGPNSGWTAENGHVPGSQGGAVVFHGTAEEHIKSILNNGIRLQYGKVYATSSLEEALGYARDGQVGNTHRRGVVFEVHIPKSAMSRFSSKTAGRLYPEKGIHTVYRGSKTIPSSWIKAVYEPNKHNKMLRRELSSGDASVIYVAVMIEDSARTLGGPGSGNNGHRVLGDVVGHPFHGNQWTVGGESYHATTLDAANKIKVEGLKQGARGLVFVGDKEEVALWHGYIKSKGADVALVVIDKSAGLHPDKEGAVDHAIAAQHVKEVRLYSHADLNAHFVSNKAIPDFKTLGAGGDFYAAMVVKQNAVARTLGGPGSGWTAENGHVPGSQSGATPLTPMEAYRRKETEDFLTRSGYQKLASGQTKSGVDYEIHGTKTGSYSVLRTRDLGEIGRANVVDVHGDGPKGWLETKGPGNYLTSVSVSDEYKRQGIATKLYDAIEKHLGKKLEPSPTYRTPDAVKFWERRQSRTLGGPGSGNFGHSGRPGEVGGSGDSLSQIADTSLPKDTATHEYFYHAFDRTSTADKVEAEGVKPGSGNNKNIVWLSKDEIRDRGAGFAIVRVPTGSAVAGHDVVEGNLRYREWTTTHVPKEDVVRVVREIPNVNDPSGHGVREDQLAKYALTGAKLTDKEKAALPPKYQAWFRSAAAKSKLPVHSIADAAVPSPGATLLLHHIVGRLEPRAAYAPDQERDERGHWTDGGGYPVRPDADGVNVFGTTDKYVYHISDPGIPLSRFDVGLKPSTRGYEGPGVYLANTPENTQYYQQLGEGRLFRIDKEALVRKFGRYPEQKDGVQYDDYDGSLLLEGTRSIPKEFIEVQEKGRWRALEFDPSQERDENGQWSEDGIAVADVSKVDDRIKGEVTQLARTIFASGALDDVEAIHIVGSWAQQRPDRKPDRKGDGSSDIDLMIEPKVRSERLWDVAAAIERTGVDGRGVHVNLEPILGGQKGVTVWRAPKARGAEFSPDQPRDEHGQWAAGAGVTDGDVADASIKWATDRYPKADLTETKRSGLHPRDPLFRGEVDGLRVRTGIPNTDSISATFSSEEYDELRGIRAVPIADLDPGVYAATDDNARTQRLADAIKESGEISPLIVVVGGDRKPYVLEGGHRVRALALLGVKAVPALVIVDHTAITRAAEFNPDQERDERGQWTTGGGDRLAPSTSSTSDRPLSASQIRSIAVAQARKMGFHPNRIKVVTHNRTFSVGGRNYEEVGRYISRDRVISINSATAPANKAEVAALVAHEVSHDAYRKVESDYIDSMFKEGSGASAVVAYSRFKFDHEQELIRKDGVSDYSKAYWRAAGKGTDPAKVSRAINETLAEIARLGKVRSVAPVWRELYTKLHRAYRSTR